MNRLIPETSGACHLLTKVVALVVFTLPWMKCSAQKSDFWSVNFANADSIAFKFHGYSLRNPEALADSLTCNLTTDVEKFRAIFRWITDNISYDYPQYLKAEKSETSTRRGGNKSSELTAYLPKKSFRSLMIHKKAICAGYATLLDYMCNHIGLESAFISGHSRGHGQIRRQKANHAWNAVKLNGKWYLCDVTWASGFVDTGNERFFKKYSDLYFLTDPSLFVCNHYPSDKSWLLLQNPPSLTQFYGSPYKADGFIRNKINHYFPSMATVQIKLEEKFQMRFTSNRDFIKDLAKIIYKDKRKEYIKKDIKLSRNNAGEFVLEHVFTEKGTYAVEVYINDHYTIRYQVIVL